MTRIEISKEKVKEIYNCFLVNDYTWCTWPVTEEEIEESLREKVEELLDNERITEISSWRLFARREFDWEYSQIVYWFVDRELFFTADELETIRVDEEAEEETIIEVDGVNFPWTTSIEDVIKTLKFIEETEEEGEIEEIEIESILMTIEERQRVFSKTIIEDLREMMKEVV